MPGCRRIDANRRQLDGERVDEARDAAVDRVTVVEPGYGRRSASPPKSRIEALVREARQERVDDLGVPDELQRHEPERARHVVGRRRCSRRARSRRARAGRPGRRPPRPPAIVSGLGEVEARTRSTVAGRRSRPPPPEHAPSSRPVITTSRPRAAYVSASRRPIPAVPPTITTAPSLIAPTIEAPCSESQLAVIAIVPLYHAESVLQTCCLRA